MVAHMVSILISTHSITSHSEKVKGRLHFVFNVAHFTERFKQKDSVINTSAITAVTKSSMKPCHEAMKQWYHRILSPQAVVEKGMENKGEQR